MTLFERFLATAAENPKRIVFPEADEPRTLQAVARLHAERIVVPVLVGSREAALAKAREIGVSLEGIAIEGPTDSPHREAAWSAVRAAVAGTRHSESEAATWLGDPTHFAAALVRAGVADGSVSGAAHTTADTLRAALRIIRPAAGAKVVSSFFLMGLASATQAGDDVLAFADCALVPYPDAAQLADIAFRTAHNFRALTGREPRVALLSFSTKASAQHEAVATVRQALEILEGMALDFAADGEMQFDAAIDPEIGSSKAPGSSVAGRANVLVFPNLDAGNIGYKIAQRLGGAFACGPVLQGLSRPANDLSRGCSVEDIVHVAAITALQSGAGA